MAPIPVIKIVGSLISGNASFQNSSVGNTVGSATSVYIYNGNTAIQQVYVANVSGNTANIGSIPIPPATAIILRKYPYQMIYTSDNTSNLMFFTSIASLD